MSELREQLQAMRDEYRGEKYPGDLAAEILSPPPRRLPVGKIVAATSTLLALAAAVALFVSIEPAVLPPSVSPTPAGGDTVAVIPMNELEAMSVDATMPALSADMPLVPASESITDIGAMPSIPAMDMNLSFETETSEESA